MQLAAVLMARPEHFKIIGCTAVHGNTDHEHVLQNAGSILNLFRLDNRIPYFPGAQAPLDKPALDGDGAHGDNGIGGILMPKANKPAQRQAASQFIIEQLRTNEPNTITITATGPLSNLAQVLRDSPETLSLAKQIIVMGGCTEKMPANDMAFRKGNITPDAEFNFHMAAADARSVIQSGVAPTVLFPLNCTQQMEFTPKRELQLRRALRGIAPQQIEQIIGMMKAPEWLDQMKFDSHSFMHDIHTALYLVRPDLYEGEYEILKVDDTEANKNLAGNVTAQPALDEIHRHTGQHNVLVMKEIKDTDKLFDIYIDSLRRLMLPKVPLYPTAVPHL